MKADLHMHTNYSDGTETPTEMVHRAAKLDFDVIAITDHDTIGGVGEALEAAEERGIRVVPGVEITAQFHQTELHILAYFPIKSTEESESWKSPELLDHLKTYSDCREKRAEQIVRKLNFIGVDVTMQDVHGQANLNEAGTLGRPHIAAALVSKKYVSSMDEAFSEYLKKGRPGWVDKKRPETREVIELVHRAGGIASLAHPGLLRETGIPQKLCEEGIDCVEVYHTRHTSHQSARFREYAEEHDLIVTGGSDCHGMLKGEPLLGRIELRGNDLIKFLAKLD